MTDINMQALAVLRKQIAEGQIDVPRELVKMFAEQLMAAEAAGLCGAGLHERSDDVCRSPTNHECTLPVFAGVFPWCGERGSCEIVNQREHRASLPTIPVFRGELPYSKYRIIR